MYNAIRIDFARAAEAVSSSGWTSTPSGDVFGGEGQMDSERVDLDEFCFPELQEKLTDEKLDEQILGLRDKSKLETVEARERYVQIIRAHKEAFCMGLKDFKPGQVDAPQLKLHVTPGPPIRQPRRQLSPDKAEWLGRSRWSTTRQESGSLRLLRCGMSCGCRTR